MNRREWCLLALWLAFAGSLSALLVGLVLPEVSPPPPTPPAASWPGR